MSTRRIAAIASAAVLLGLLAGCSPTVSNFAGVPTEDVAQKSDETDSGLQAFWLLEGSNLAISIWGSSTCPEIATALHVVKNATEGNVVSVDVAPIGDKVCTRDFVPHTTTFSTPSDITTTKPLTVQVGDNSVILPPK